MRVFFLFSNQCVKNAPSCVEEEKRKEEKKKENQRLEKYACILFFFKSMFENKM